MFEQMLELAAQVDDCILSPNENIILSILNKMSGFEVGIFNNVYEVNIDTFN
jgi:hypothetical protein